MRFSIVVPVYNVKEYLESCINSIISQDFNDYEIILVDDGSTDGSGELCDYYKKIHNKIIVIHQPNGGLSNARNNGIIRSKGEYIIFLDSDDCLIEHSLSKINEEMLHKQCDIFVGYAVSFDEFGKKEEKGRLNNFPRKVISGEQYIHILSKHRREVSFCSTFMIYNAAFIKNNSLKFEEGILHEDELWTPQVLIKAKRICWINIPFYYHRIREGSIMHSSNYDKRTESIIIICKKLLILFSNNKTIDLRYLRDRMVMIYLSIVPVVNDPHNYKLKMGHFFTIKNMRFINTSLKSIMFTISADLYKRIYNAVK